MVPNIPADKNKMPLICRRTIFQLEYSVTYRNKRRCAWNGDQQNVNTMTMTTMN